MRSKAGRSKTGCGASCARSVSPLSVSPLRAAMPTPGTRKRAEAPRREDLVAYGTLCKRLRTSRLRAQELLAAPDAKNVTSALDFAESARTRLAQSVASMGETRRMLDERRVKPSIFCSESDETLLASSQTALLAARTLLEDLAGERVAAAKHQLNDFLTAPEFRDLGASSCASAQADALERATYYRHARQPRVSRRLTLRAISWPRAALRPAKRACSCTSERSMSFAAVSPWPGSFLWSSTPFCIWTFTSFASLCFRLYEI